MNDSHDIRGDLEPDVADELVVLAERLHDRRPPPRATFRGQLRRRLLARGPLRGRPVRLREMVVGYGTAGALLLLVGALSAAGIGPLGA